MWRYAFEMRTCVILHKKCLSLNGILSAKTSSFILKPKNKAKSGLFGCSKLNENVEKLPFLRQNWKLI